MVLENDLYPKVYLARGEDPVSRRTCVPIYIPQLQLTFLQIGVFDKCYDPYAAVEDYPRGLTCDFTLIRLNQRT